MGFINFVQKFHSIFHHRSSNHTHRTCFGNNTTFDLTIIHLLGVCKYALIHPNRGFMCQKKQSMIERRNYIPQIQWGVITMPCPWFGALRSRWFGTGAVTRVPQYQGHNPERYVWNDDMNTLMNHHNTMTVQVPPAIYIWYRVIVRSCWSWPWM